MKSSEQYIAAKAGWPILIYKYERCFGDIEGFNFLWMKWVRRDFFANLTVFEASQLNFELSHHKRHGVLTSIALSSLYGKPFTDPFPSLPKLHKLCRATLTWHISHLHTRPMAHDFGHFVTFASEGPAYQWIFPAGVCFHSKRFAFFFFFRINENTILLRSLLLGALSRTCISVTMS